MKKVVTGKGDDSAVRREGWKRERERKKKEKSGRIQGCK